MQSSIKFNKWVYSTFYNHSTYIHKYQSKICGLSENFKNVMQHENFYVRLNKTVNNFSLLR